MLNRNTLGPITVCIDVVSAVVHIHLVPLYLVSKQTWILNRRPLWLKCLRSDDMTLSQPSAVHRPWLTKCHLCFVCGAGSLAGSTTDALRSESSTGSSQLSPIPSPGMCCREVRPFMCRHTHTQAHTHTLNEGFPNLFCFLNPPPKKENKPHTHIHTHTPMRNPLLWGWRGLTVKKKRHFMLALPRLATTAAPRRSTNNTYQISHNIIIGYSFYTTFMAPCPLYGPRPPLWEPLD